MGIMALWVFPTDEHIEQKGKKRDEKEACTVEDEMVDGSGGYEIGYK
jgi:hypothetical protein